MVCCLCLCKDTNFLANHNRTVLYIDTEMDVYASAKILFLANHNAIMADAFNLVVVYASEYTVEPTLLCTLFYVALL